MSRRDKRPATADLPDDGVVRPRGLIPSVCWWDTTQAVQSTIARAVARNQSCWTAAATILTAEKMKLAAVKVCHVTPKVARLARAAK